VDSTRTCLSWASRPDSCKSSASRQAGFASAELALVVDICDVQGLRKRSKWSWRRPSTHAGAGAEAGVDFHGCATCATCQESGYARSSLQALTLSSVILIVIPVSTLQALGT
jgi:hypothetical protein